MTDTDGGPSNGPTSNNTVSHCGWLVKEGSVRKSWKLRWFALRDGQLRYFANDSETTVKGTLAMNGASVDVVDGVNWVQSFGDNLDTVGFGGGGGRIAMRWTRLC